MGQAASSPSILGPYLSSPRRFNIKQLNVGESSHAAGIAAHAPPAFLGSAGATKSGGAPLVCTADTKDPAKINAKRADGRPLEFVLNNEELMLKADFQPLLPLRFTLNLAVMPGDAIHSLTFITGMTRRDVDSLVNNSASELLSNPNLQNEENVVVLGDYTAPDQPLFKQVEFAWTWEIPASAPPGGWPLYFCFAEYDKDEHVLKKLAGGSLWIAEQPTHNSIEMLLSPIQAPQHLSTDVLSPDNSLLSPVPDINATGIPHLAPDSRDIQPSGLFSPSGEKLGEPLVVPDIELEKRRDSAPSTATGPSLATVTTTTTNASSGTGSGTGAGTEVSKPLPRIEAERPHPDRAVQPEDGPSFRSSITDMESRMVPLKSRVKQLLKRSMLVNERLQALVEAEQWLANAVVLAAESDMPALRPIIAWVTAHWSQGAYATRLKLRKAYARELSQRIVEPLRELYEQDVKMFDVRRREFADESSQYYSWVSRYLSNTKKSNSPKDAKYTEKRRQFELARFDYYTFLLDIHGGRSQQMLLLRFAQYFQGTGDAITAAGNSISKNGKQSIDESVEDLKDALKEWQQQRLDRETKRRTLERSIATGSSAEDESAPDARPSDAQVYKEGLLWALSRPSGVQNTQSTNKQGLKWHKYWVVQSGGQVCEYTNWKQSMDLHNDPINLLLASVREAKGADRRFCFEVVTPQFKRIYQATSDEDMRSWIASITRGISSMLEQNGAGAVNDAQLAQATIITSNSSVGSSAPKKLETLTRKLSLKEHRPRVPPINTHWHSNAAPPSSHGASSMLSAGGPMSAPPQSISSAIPPNFGNGSLSAHPNGSSHQPAATRKSHEHTKGPIPPPPVEDYSKASKLLTRVQSISGNRTCADCGSSKNVDWVSLNTLAVVCIECSGTHRSLGTHISKMRSLNLDTFSPDWEAVILRVSNPEVNRVWEQQSDKANRARPQGGCQATSASRIKFISEKYVEKQFTKEVEKPNAALRRAIQEQDLIGALAALVSCANPNGTSDAGEPMIVDAVRCAPANSVVFPVAELLCVNGGSLQPGTAAPNGLSENALAYLSSRFELGPPSNIGVHRSGAHSPASHMASTAHMSPIARKPLGISGHPNPSFPTVARPTSSASSALTGPALNSSISVVSSPAALPGHGMPSPTATPASWHGSHSVERIPSGSNDGSCEDLHSRRVVSNTTDSKGTFSSGSRSSLILEAPQEYAELPLNHSRIRTK